LRARVLAPRDAAATIAARAACIARVGVAKTRFGACESQGKQQARASLGHTHVLKKARQPPPTPQPGSATEDQLHAAEERRALPEARATKRTPEATAGTSARVITNEMRHACV
jgi:hypothetical protein